MEPRRPAAPSAGSAATVHTVPENIACLHVYISGMGGNYCVACSALYAPNSGLHAGMRRVALRAIFPSTEPGPTVWTLVVGSGHALQT